VGALQRERLMSSSPPLLCIDATLPAPDTFTASAFEYANGLAWAVIQHLMNERGHRIASRAAAVAIRRLFADSTKENLAKFRASEQEARRNGFYVAPERIVFGPRKSGHPRHSAG
jgi:hypothetical protein